MSEHIIQKHPLPVAGLMAVLSVPVHLFLPSSWSYAFAAVLLALIAGIYVGFAVVNDRPQQIVLQLLVAILFAVFATVAWLVNPFWLAAGYAAHGLWDIAHHLRLSKLSFPRWYIPLCAAYDLAAGVGLALIWSIK